MSKTSADIYIYSEKSLLQRTGKDRDELEDDLETFFGEAGDVTGAGAGNAGWHLDLHLHDASDLERWLERLAAFLQNWGVPQDTYLEVFVTTGPRRIDVFSRRDD
jgi:hypothetical protein